MADDDASVGDPRPTPARVASGASGAAVVRRYGVAVGEEEADVDDASEGDGSALDTAGDDADGLAEVGGADVVPLTVGRGELAGGVDSGADDDSLGGVLAAVGLDGAGACDVVAL